MVSAGFHSLFSLAYCALVFWPSHFQTACAVDSHWSPALIYCLPFHQASRRCEQPSFLPQLFFLLSPLSPSVCCFLHQPLCISLFCFNRAHLSLSGIYILHLAGNPWSDLFSLCFGPSWSVVSGNLKAIPPKGIQFFYGKNKQTSFTIHFSERGVEFSDMCLFL